MAITLKIYIQNNIVGIFLLIKMLICYHKWLFTMFLLNCCVLYCMLTFADINSVIVILFPTLSHLYYPSCPLEWNQCNLLFILNWRNLKRNDADNNNTKKNQLVSCHCIKVVQTQIARRSKTGDISLTTVTFSV